MNRYTFSVPAYMVMEIEAEDEADAKAQAARNCDNMIAYGMVGDAYLLDKEPTLVETIPDEGVPARNRGRLG